MFQYLLFSYIGGEITEGIKRDSFRKILRLPIAWYEKEENSGGSAAVKLGVDTEQVSNLMTTMISTIFMNASTILLGIVLSFVFEWRLGIMALFFIPLIVFVGSLQIKFHAGLEDTNKENYELAAKLS